MKITFGLSGCGSDIGQLQNAQMNMNRITLFVAAVLCINSGYSQERISFTTSDYVRALKDATDVMVNDVTSPVAAARYYAYINLSANETATLFDNQQPRFVRVVK